ncbi:hypothetical protein BLSTO_04665 [Blastocystis sp. subtype 1]
MPSLPVQPAYQPVQPAMPAQPAQPVQPVQTSPRPAPFMPTMPVMSSPVAQPAMPAQLAQPVEEPVAEMPVTAEQQAVLDAIQRTITLLGDADLSMPQKAIVAKEQEAMKVMETQFKRGMVSAEALALLGVMREKLDAFSYGEAEDVYKKLNMEFWKVHKEWLLPLKHFLSLCKKMSS